MYNTKTIGRRCGGLGVPTTRLLPCRPVISERGSDFLGRLNLCWFLQVFLNRTRASSVISNAPSRLQRQLVAVSDGAVTYRSTRFDPSSLRRPFHRVRFSIEGWRSRRSPSVAVKVKMTAMDRAPLYG